MPMLHLRHRPSEVTEMEYLNLGGNATSHERNSVLCSEESAATGADGFPTVSLARGEIGIIDTGDEREVISR